MATHVAFRLTRRPGQGHNRHPAVREELSSVKGDERITRNHEIDFIVNSGSRKLYIQSAFSMDGKKQMERETLPLKKTGDFFGKIVVRSGYMRPMQDDDGIMHVGLIPFLLEPEILSAALG